jgi:hypothetical protein
MLRSTSSKALAAGAAIVVGSLGLMMSPAGAAEPANQACLGESFSDLAGPGFGPGVVSFAQNPGPFGDGIQAVQAGVVPDAVVPNTCND